MPRLVEVAREEDEDQDGRYHGSLARRQLAIDTDDMRTMIAEFEDPCNASGVSSSGASMSLKVFSERLTQLESVGSGIDALSVDYDHFVAFLPQVVPCIGCRKCVEKTFLEVGTMNSQTLEPFYITDSAILSVSPALLSDHKRLHRSLVGNYSKCCAVVENLTKIRKSKRCQLHSLDNHQCRSSRCCWSWEDMWDVMSSECREECCIIEADSLLEMLETYLQKHKFCPDCKSKLMRAYHCLIGEVDGTKEAGYNAQLFKGLKYCRSEAHLHVKPYVAYLDALMDRADAELQQGGGAARERHAKTLEVGQIEVLICIGLYLHGRLLRLTQAMRAGQLAFQLLYATSVMAVYSKFQACTEPQNGWSESFERLCAELQTSAADPSKFLVQEKRKKKKKQPNKVAVTNGASGGVRPAVLKCANGTSCGGSEVGSGGRSSPSEDGGYSSREGSPLAHPVKECTVGCCAKRSWDSCEDDFGLHAADENTKKNRSPLKSTSNTCTPTKTPTDGGVATSAFLEQIEWFRRNSGVVDRERQALRERMWTQFRAMEDRLSHAATGPSVDVRTALP